ncbi:hypothetical protein [Pseudonocardia alaniniphila]|uniref:Uncharacterized protein n=1 Tax=Pseudonocardia alaniniphila TaxID=75291 RepID=A0ABS9T9A7_9PSEU|nr:hypothetical protein [Pseudonocardia alaniniphila]MCH6164886.1 hypothetical protein [Pseudonocardia alaniniphila]
MGGSLAALLIAALGVIGTLSSALLTQHVNARARMAELEHDHRTRRAEEDRGRRQALLDKRHACYVALNMADWQFHSTLLLHIDALRTGVDTERTNDSMEAARDAMREQWGEAQLVLPDALLPLAEKVNHILWKVYEMVRRIERGHAEVDESLERATTMLQKAKGQVFDLRKSMREDLGIGDPDREP